MGGRRTFALIGSLVVILAGCTSGGSTLPVVGPGATAPPATTSETATTGGASGARFADQAAATAVLRDVRDAVEVLNTYDYRDLDTARRNGLTKVTGRLSADFRRTFDEVVAPRAVPMHTEQRARVDEIGLVTLRGKQANLLVFGTLDIARDGDSSRDPFTLTVRASRVRGVWKLAEITNSGRVTGTPPGTAALAEAVVVARRTAVAYVVLPASGGGGVETVAVERAAGSSVDVIVSARGFEIAEGNEGDPRDLQLRFTLERFRSQWIPGTVHVLPGS